MRGVDRVGEVRGARGRRTKESAMMVLRPAAILKVGTLAVVLGGPAVYLFRRFLVATELDVSVGPLSV